MLTAIGADPTRCGYTEDQIPKCIRDLATRGVHQETAGAQHLMWMLLQKGMVERPAASVKSIREHPEILKLRFDSEHAPVDGIPIDLRKPLYKIYMEHAGGAARHAGRKWVNFNLFSDAGMTRPYPFEMERKKKQPLSASRAKPSPADQNHVWAELNWPDVEKRLKKVDMALLPVGAIEQHGPHLPLDTDAFDADYLARRVAEACSEPKPLVLPLISYGVSYHHDEFKGTLSITNRTLSGMVYDIGMSAAKNGINKLIIINGHGGNSPALNYAAQMINRDAGIFVCIDTGETSDVDISAITETSNDVHSGEIETSTALAVRPHLVKMDRARKLVPGFSSRYLDFSSKRSVSWYAYTKRFSSTGVMGDPTKATAEKGEKMWKIMITHLVSLVEDLKSITLDEIYQRRY